MWHIQNRKICRTLNEIFLIFFINQKSAHSHKYVRVKEGKVMKNLWFISAVYQMFRCCWWCDIEEAEFSSIIILARLLFLLVVDDLLTKIPSRRRTRKCSDLSPLRPSVDRKNNTFSSWSLAFCVASAVKAKMRRRDRKFFDDIKRSFSTSEASFSLKTD